jgi:hypothetical protein
VVGSVVLLTVVAVRLWTRDGHWVAASVFYGLLSLGPLADIWTSRRRLRLLAGEGG